MSGSDRRSWGRREFLARVTVVGVTGFAGLRPTPAGTEPPPETTRIPLIKAPGTCPAPQYVAEDLLRAEGFSDIQYVPKSRALATGEVDFATCVCRELT